jgi:PAS domain S-box-containing protein
MAGPDAHDLASEALFQALGDNAYELDRGFRFLTFNAGCAAYYDTPPELALGRPIWEVLPGTAGSWLEQFLREAMAGRRPVRVERPGVMHPERWVEVTAFPTARGLGVAFRDRTAEHRTAQAMRRREARQAFLLAFEERLRGLADPDEVMAAAAEMLGRHLGAARAGYAEMDGAARMLRVTRDWTDGRIPRRTGQTRPLDAFGPPAAAELRAGRVVVVEDCLADPRTMGETVAATWASIGIRALVVAPLVKAGTLTAFLYAHDTGPRRWSDSEVELVREVAERTWATVERARAEAERREGEARLRLAVAAGRMAVWEYDVAADRLTGSPELHRLLGLPEDAMPGLAELQSRCAPGEHERVRSVGEAALARGEHFFEAECRILLPEGAARWLLMRAELRLGEEGSPGKLFGVVLDVTGRKQAEERQALLMREVDHRAKNALAVVQAAVRLTRAPDLESYRQAIERRVAALVRAQTLLAEDRWAGADLRALLEGELAAFLGEGQRATLDGPPVALPAEAAQPLAMAFHELATNAVKYGALSAPSGRVAVSWRVAAGAQPALRLRWAESGGPAVTAPPERRGFGSRVLEGTVRGQLGGSVALAWAPSGLACDMEIPLTRGGTAA